MAALLAPALLLAIARGATADADVGLRVDTRSSTVQPVGVPETSRVGYSVAPELRAAVTGGGLRLGAVYAPRVWSVDVSQRAPIVDHSLDARLATFHDAPWNAEVGAGATRGTTDPLTDPLRGTGPSRVASAEPLAFEAARADARLKTQLDARSELEGGAGVSATQGGDAAARAIIPRQEVLAGDVRASHRLTERDTLGLGVGAGASRTGDGDAVVGARWASLSVSWRRALTPRLEGTIGLGAGWTQTDGAREATPWGQFPTAELGLFRAGTVALDARARLAPYADPVTGEATEMADARFSLRWPVAATIAMEATARGSARTDGETTAGGTELRVSWTVRPRLTVDAGLVATRVHDGRPGMTSYSEAGLVVGAGWAPALR